MAIAVPRVINSKSAILRRVGRSNASVGRENEMMLLVGSLMAFQQPA
jgi:hypothetical protein